MSTNRYRSITTLANANYIVNLGDATTTDVQALITEGYQKVREHSKVRLQLNLEIR